MLDADDDSLTLSSSVVSFVLFHVKYFSILYIEPNPTHFRYSLTSKTLWWNEGRKKNTLHSTFHVVHEDAWWWYDKNNNNANGSVEPNKLDAHVPIDQYGSDGNTNSKQ